jgi:CO/xanthine dehydrogenase FAD-binding subunit
MTVVVATSIDEVLAALAGPGVQVLAGGTDVMVAVNAGRAEVGSVVALRAVDALRQWSRTGTTATLGAGVTYRRLLEPDLAGLLPALAQAARAVGSPQIRNAGTLGGNLATASPAGDTLPVLLALDATVELRRAGGRRSVPVAEWLVGPKQTGIEPGELITAVHIPLVRGPQEFLKVGVRNAMVIAIASLALVVDLDRRGVRVALGSVGSTVLRAPDAEAFAAAHLDWSHDGARLRTPELADRFADLVAAAARPIDDHRASARYRRHAVSVLARRALLRCVTSDPDGPR